MISIPSRRTAAAAVGLALLVGGCAAPPSTSSTAATAAGAQSDLVLRNVVRDAFDRLAAAANFTSRTTVVNTVSTTGRSQVTQTSTTTCQVQEGGPAVYTVVSDTPDGPRTRQSVRFGDRLANELKTGAWTVWTPPRPVAESGRPQRNMELAQYLPALDRLHHLRRDGDVIVGKLGPMPGGADGPQSSDATREVRYWIRDGILVKQQFDVHVVRPAASGPATVQDQRTAIEFCDIGTTKVVVPAAARAALGL